MATRLIVATGLGLALLAGCATTPDESAAPSVTATPSVAPSEAPRVLELDFDGPDPTALSIGTAQVRVQSVHGGELTLIPHNGGKAANFPEFSEEDEPEGLALVLTGGADSIPNPGPRDFAFGAEVLMYSDEASEQDNGDNVMQRGLAADSSQYKLQVDHGVPSCVVAGSDGRLFVKGPRLQVDVWYALKCARIGDQLVITITNQSDESVVAKAVGGPIGSVSLEPDRPLSIGRKVTAWGEPVVNQPDQFNGALDSVWVSLG